MCAPGGGWKVSVFLLTTSVVSTKLLTLDAPTARIVQSWPLSNCYERDSAPTGRIRSKRRTWNSRPRRHSRISRAEFALAFRRFWEWEAGEESNLFEHRRVRTEDQVGCRVEWRNGGLGAGPTLLQGFINFSSSTSNLTAPRQHHSLLLRATQLRSDPKQIRNS